MPVAVLIPAIAALAGGAISAFGSESAANTNAAAAAKAQALAAQQAAAQQAQQNTANQFSLEQAQQQAANLAQYRAARQAVLGSFGINAPAGSISMPASSAGINSAPTTAAGVTAANPLLASLQGAKAPYTNPFIGPAAIGAGAVGLGALAKFAFPSTPGQPPGQVGPPAALAGNPAGFDSSFLPQTTPANPGAPYAGDLSGGNPFQVNVPQVTGIDPAVLAAYQGSVS